MRPQGLTTRQVSGRRPFQFQPHAQATRWRKRRRKNRFQKEGRSWSPRACERLWGPSAASRRRCPSPTIPPPGLTPARRGRSVLSAAHIEHALAAESAPVLANQLHVVNARVEGGREMLFVTRGLVQGRPDAARNSGVSRGPSGRENQRFQFTPLRPRKENRKPELVIVKRPIALGIVHGGDVHSTWS